MKATTRDERAHNCRPSHSVLLIHLPSISSSHSLPVKIRAMSEDEFDNVSDDFELFDWNAIPELAGPCSTVTIAATSTQTDPEPDTLPTILPRPLSANSSTDYSCDDELDASFFAELDALEQEIIRRPARSTNPAGMYL